jgi:hypothetical protein
MSEYTQQWLVAYIWTLAIEVPLMVLILRRASQTMWVPTLLALVVNTVTHPTLWFVFPEFRALLPSYAAWVTVAEAFVWTGEALMLTLMMAPEVGLKRSVKVGPLAAVVANAASTAIGLVFF